VKKLRSLVLEDEWSARNYLAELLEASQLATVVAAAADTEQAWAALGAGETLNVDVAFVDVRLAGEPVADAGVAWLRSVIADSRTAGLRFVLTTASRDHALEAYQLGVVDYVLKPFTGERVVTCLKKLVKERAPSVAASPPRVVARQGRNIVFLRAPEVLAFEAAEGVSYVYTDAGKFEIDLSLAALGASLGDDFLRVHRNWLVGVAAVRTLERETGDTRLLVGSSSLAVPVARDRIVHVREALVESAIGLRKASKV
jgi:two-component system, LytTR family, response regulator LytT